MCKWNKFRGNNSTTIPLQSAAKYAREVGSFAGCAAEVSGTQTTRSLSLYRGIPTGWWIPAPFDSRVLPQIYSVLLPFWYINFYSIWFAAIAMVIERKRVLSRATLLSLEVSFLHPRRSWSPCLFSPSLPRPTSILFSASAIDDYSKGTFRGFRAPKRAITTSSATLSYS